MIDAQAWLDWHCPPNRPQLAEPTRDERLPERLEPGDVLDNGDIVTGDKCFRFQGVIWLPLRKALAACYYGWQWTDVSFEVGPTTVWKVERWSK